MDAKFHPDAVKNFDEKAQKLVAELAPETHVFEGCTDHIAQPGGYISAHISEEELIEFKTKAMTDPLGRTLARLFEHEGKLVGLSEESYERLARLSESIQKTKGFRDKVSLWWVEDVVVDWLEAKYKEQTSSPMTEYMVRRCADDVEEAEIWVPVSQMSVEADLAFGNITFRSVSRAVIDGWEEKARAERPDLGAQTERFFVHQRQKYQGLAAATIKLVAEPVRAVEIALEETERALSLLRVFSPAARDPRMTSYCAVLGRENVESTSCLLLVGGMLRGSQEAPVDDAIVHWHLSGDRVSTYRKWGLDGASRLLTQEKRTKFQESLLDALLLYSRATLEKDISGKLVYVLVAVESVLLKNDGESIQQNVGERMAFLIGRRVSERRWIIGNLKSAYALRSKFVHHGQSIDDVKTIGWFFYNVWRLFITLLHNADRYVTKEQLIEALEARKLS